MKALIMIFALAMTAIALYLMSVQTADNTSRIERLEKGQKLEWRLP